MKIYTIGKTKTECYGHGDYGSETTIRELGAYGEGGFPPCFMDKQLAVDWLNDYGNDGAFKYYLGETKIVELDLREP